MSISIKSEGGDGVSIIAGEDGLTVQVSYDSGFGYETEISRNGAFELACDIAGSLKMTEKEAADLIGWVLHRNLTDDERAALFKGCEHIKKEP